MRYVSIFITAVVLLACAACGGLFGPGEPTIRLEGTVTAADDGSPIIGGRVLVFQGFGRPFHTESVRADASGRYSLSYATEGEGCNAADFGITVGGVLGFIDPEFHLLLLWEGTSGIRCKEEVQTLDFQLERKPSG